MNVTYRYLTNLDTPELDRFCKESETSSKAKQWLIDGLNKKTDKMIIVGEFVNDELNGFLSACTVGYWHQARHELLPIWLAVRLDRLGKTSDTFTKFMQHTTRLVTLHFENMKYFQFYLIKRLPKKEMSNNEIAILATKTWAINPYSITVERIIKTSDDYENLPTTFKTMIGEFKTPLVVLSCTLDNFTREERSHNSK